jgi:hypothetical protein
MTVSGITAANAYALCPNQVAPSSRFRQTLARAWFWLSGGLSLLCAVHCALVPLMFVLMPTLKMALYSVRDPSHKMAIFLLQSVRFEQPLVFIGLGLTALTIGQAWLRGKVTFRQQRFVWALFAAGAVLTIAGAMSPAREVLLHALLMLSGGLLLVGASLQSARLGHATNMVR